MKLNLTNAKCREEGMCELRLIIITPPASQLPNTNTREVARAVTTDHQAPGRADELHQVVFRAAAGGGVDRIVWTLAYDPWTLIVTNPAGSSKIL